MGGTPLGDLPEDVEAKRILMERQITKEEDSTQALANAIAQSQLQIAQTLYAQQTGQPIQPVEQPQTTLEQPSFSDEEDENPVEESNDGLSN